MTHDIAESAKACIVTYPEAKEAEDLVDFGANPAIWYVRPIWERRG